MLTAERTGSPASADWIEKLKFSCPTCRAPLPAPDASHAPKCERCGFQATRIDGVVGFIPGDAVHEWRDFYEAKASAEHGDSTGGVGYSYSSQHRYMIEGFRRILQPHESDSAILDVGCGNGIFARALFGTKPVIGVDFSRHMCQLAQIKGMTVYQADALALPFADAQFDLVYSAEVLQHIADLPALLAEFARVCRPGGHIVISTLNRTSWYRQGYFFARDLVLGDKLKRGRAVMRSAKEIAAAARAHSLSARTTCWTHFPTPAVHCTAGIDYSLEPLASNFIIELVKPATPA